jgi:hypothetical protein
MNLPDVLVWGPIATVVMTTIESGAQGLGLSRVSMPFVLGTMLTANRDRAGIVGFFIHVAVGVTLAFVYALVFEQVGATWWIGGIIGAVHALFVLAGLMPVLPAIHPRMASETAGPDQLRQLQPPGFFALHYGRRTMALVLASHVAYGAVLGAFYRPTENPGSAARPPAAAARSYPAQPTRVPTKQRPAPALSAMPPGARSLA